MVKLKTPLLSFGAHGSVGEAVTFRESRSTSIAEKKPELPFFLTLPVQYQRWLYQDYVYLWTQQSIATKQVYASAGVRHHLTGFQYWMKYHLTNLPDVSGMWRLDAVSGATAPDSSRNGNTGTIVGASPATGRIAGGLHFDGLNDQVHAPTAGFDYLRGTWECFFSADVWTDNTYRAIISGDSGPTWIELQKTKNSKELSFPHQGVAPILTFSPAAPFQDSVLYHVAVTWDFDADLYFGYIDGVLRISSVAPVIPPANPTSFYIGSRYNNTTWWNGLIDHVFCWRRPLDATQILMHSLRRWP